MIDTLKIFDELKNLIEPNAARKIAEILGEIYKEIVNTVTKEEFKELKNAMQELVETQKNTEQRMKELTEAQRETEHRMGKLEERMEELTEAQKETEHRMGKLEERMEELAEAQRETEIRMGRLETKMEELAEAQRETEHRMGKLETRMEELAEAQRKTEEEVKSLAISLKETRKMVGGLSDTVGYGLEDRAMKYLPEILKERYGITVKGRLIRKFVKYNGEEEEINIYGIGKKNEKEIEIIGEAKANLSRKDVDSFLKK